MRTETTENYASDVFQSRKIGSLASEMQSNPIDDRPKIVHTSTPAISSEARPQPAVRPLVRFNCGKPGHIAARSTNGAGELSDASGAGAGVAREHKR